MSRLSPIALLLALAAPVRASDKADLNFFESKIRPVLVAQCYACHGDEAQQKKKLRGNLFLDTKAGLLKGGDSGPAIVPGKAEQSLLLKALRHDSLKMPPNGKLADSVLADFAKWIAMGAPDPRDRATLPDKRGIDIALGKKHWAFRPLTEVVPPAVENTNLVRNPIDRFLLHKLEAKNQSFAKPLAPEKFLRRLSFDLIGLPPTPEEIEAFGDGNELNKVAGQFLASDAHAERWARHWLDVARYAESGGYEFDKDRPGAHHYRDFVIKALAKDMPFNDFVRLQVAGDEIKPGDYLATSATGFLVAGPYPGQTTAKTLAPIRYDHLDDMISTVGGAFLGLSLGCARCHEHKYDPIPQPDYYHLIAALARTDSADRKLDPAPEIYRQAKADFDKAHAATLAAKERFDKEELPGRFAAWLTREKAKPAPSWLVLSPVTGATPDAEGFLAAPTQGTTAVVAHTFQKNITAIRLETSGPTKAVLLAVAAGPLVPAKKAKAGPVKLRPATDNGVYLAETPFGADGIALTLTVTFEKTKTPGRFRLALTTDGDPKAEGPTALQHGREALTLLQGQGGKLDGKNRDKLLRWFRQLDAKTNEVYATFDRSAVKEPKAKLVDVFAAASGRGGDVYYLIRGETERKNGVAKPGYLQVFTNAPEGSARWLRDKATTPRVALADWLVDDKHGAGALVARVLVNRLWQHHFGQGLVRTPNDFGARGDAPTHPGLLDYLAAKLIEGGWKLRPIHRLIVTSAAYRQSAEASAEAMKVDPNNLLWGRVPPRRLEAEAIRDALLGVSGGLDRKMFGPGTLDDNSPRRSIYLTAKRSRLSPFLQTFDAPEGIQSVGTRVSTTNAAQALALLNSPLVRQRAEKLAERAGPITTDNVPQAIERAYRFALGRRPTSKERERMTKLVAETEGGLPRAFADACHVLLCLNEFIYVD